jgi:diguanylate cyclase (GGDEF)-like protein
MSTGASPATNLDWQNNFKKKYKTPRDLLLDPNFHGIDDIEVRRNLLQTIDPELVNLDKESQDLTLQQNHKYWQKYFADKDEAAKPKEPGIIEKVTGAIGKFFAPSLPPPPEGVKGQPTPQGKGKKEPEIVRPRTQLQPNQEKAFQKWYSQWAQKAGIDPDPDNPLHKYDYRGAFKAKQQPILAEDGLYHWPSRWKDEDHPNRFVNGVDTKKEDTPGLRTPSMGNIAIDLPAEVERAKTFQLPTELQTLTPEQKGKIIKGREQKVSKAFEPQKIEEAKVEMPTPGQLPNVPSLPESIVSEGEIKERALQEARKPIPSVTIINGHPYFKLEHVKTKTEELKPEQMTKLNLQRIKESKIPIPTDRMSNAVNSFFQGIADQVPMAIKSISAIPHLAEISGQQIEGVGRIEKGLEPEPLPKLENSILYKMANDVQRKIEDRLPVNPKFQEEYWASMIPQGLGSTIGFIAMGLVGGEAGLPVAATTMASGALVQAGSTYEEAYKAGANPTQLFAAFIAGVGLGATEALPIERGLSRLDKISGGWATRWIKDRIKRGMLTGSAKGYLEEFGQEWMQNIGQDWVVSSISGEPMNMKEDNRQGIAGGVSGAVFSAFTSAIGASRARVYLRNTVSQRHQEYVDYLSKTDIPPDVIAGLLKSSKENENFLVQQLENEIDAAESNAKKKVAEFEKLTGSKAVMVMRTRDPRVDSLGRQLFEMIKRRDEAQTKGDDTGFAYAADQVNKIQAELDSIPEAGGVIAIRNVTEAEKAKKDLKTEPSWPYKVYDPSKWTTTPEAPTTPGAPTTPTEELPIGRTDVDRREVAREDKTDRRQNWPRRKQVSQMSREEIEKELLTDELTQLRNRSAWERAPFKKYVASLDLDKMKKINDVYGQDEGDRYLQHAAQGFIQSGISVYRLGGDDFVTKADTKEEIDAAMEKAQKWFDENPFIVGDDQMKVGFSYGIEESPEAAFKTMKGRKAAAEAEGKLEPRYEKPESLPPTPESITGPETITEPAAPEVTVPEKPSTVLSQIETIGSGERRVVFVPESTLQDWQKRDLINDFLSIVAEIPQLQNVDVPGKGTFFYHPNMITEDDILLAIENGEEHKLMGILDPKSAATSIGLRAEKWNPETNAWEEFLTVVTKPEHLRAQLQLLKRQVEGKGKFRFLTGSAEEIAKGTVDQRQELAPPPVETLPAPETTPKPEPTPEAPTQYGGQIFKHFTSKEAKKALESGVPFDFKQIPIHGTGDLGAGPKTSRFAGESIYLSLDDDTWSSVLSREGEDVTVDITLENEKELKSKGAEFFYDYEAQKWKAKVGAQVKKTQLESVEFRLDPGAKIIVVDSEQAIKSLASKVGQAFYRDNPEFWKAVAKKYDAVVLKNVKEIADKTDNKFFRQALADQIIVLNPEKASVVRQAEALAPPPAEGQKPEEVVTPPGKPPVPEELVAPPPPVTPPTILDVLPEPPVEKEPAQPEEITRNAQFRVFLDKVKTALVNGEKFNNPKLQAMANEAFGGERGQGKYTLRDMYDVFEGAVSEYIEESGIVDFNDPLATMTRLEELQNRLAVQSDRTTEQIDLQQFSTPPMQAFLAAYALGNSSSPLLGLEPSAGTGMLATMMRIHGYQVRANEIDERRVTVLKLRNFPTTTVDALHLTTTGTSLSDYTPDVILMNPPFSAGPGKLHGMEFGARHVMNALQKLAPGGRLVAIVGEGMGHHRSKFNKWWNQVQAHYNVRADLGLKGSYYQKMGTTYDNRLIVIDKTGPTPGDTGAERSLKVLMDHQLTPGEALEKLSTIAAEDIHERITRPKPIESIQAPPPIAGPVIGPAEPPVGTGGGMPGVTGGRPGVPTGNESRPGELGHIPESGERGPGPSIPGPPPTHIEGKPSDAERIEKAPGLGGEHGAPVSGGPGDVAPIEIALDAQNKVLGEEETDAYVKYQPRKAIYKGAQPHPADLIESATLGSVEAPDITVKLNLPAEVISTGQLSSAQLEAITYAIQRFGTTLPDGKTAGFWIGDGTGVGKGREGAGIIYHYLRETGQKKAVWISATQQLFEDAKRDIGGVGVPLSVIHQNESRFAKGVPIDNTEGVLFTQYMTAAADWKGKRERFNQIVNWLQPTEADKEFEGVIIFDECHAMKNAVGSNQGGASTSATGTDRGEMGLLLAETFPKAKILYVSATGATLAHNMGYMNRLGLWGQGTAFADFDAFMNAMNAGGLGAMEMLSRDLKSLGSFISRQISYRGVNYDYVNHDLNEYQLEQYNKSAKLWSALIKRMEEAEANANQSHGGTRYSQFYSTQQRFFLMLMTTYQMQSVLTHLDESLKKGMAPIVNILSTNETLMRKEVAKAEAAGKSIEDIDIGPRQMIRSYIENYFPLDEYEDVPDPDNPQSTIKVPTGEINQENLRMQEDLLNELEYLNLPDNPIDMIANHLGGWGKVAEISGRTERIEGNKLVRRKPAGKKPGETINNAELRRFQNGEADVLIITGAGSAGISAQSERGIPTEGKRRIMYCAQLSWSADQQMQFFGRAHRSNQVTPPVIMLVKTNVMGQQRLINAVSRRLASLGAVTQGNRESLGGSLFDIEDLTDGYGRTALMSLTHDLAHNNYEVRGDFGNSMDILDAMGWLTPNGSLKPGVDTNVEGFLNRIMVLPVDVQNDIFNNFYSRYQANLAVAKEQGTFDTGISKIRGSNIVITKEEVIYKDPNSHMETKFLEMEGDFKTEKLKWDNIPRSVDLIGFVTNKRSGKISAAYNYVDPLTGALKIDLRTVRFTKNRIEVSDFNENYERVEGTPKEKLVTPERLPGPPVTSLEQAKDLWEKEFAAIPETTRKPVYMVTGAVFPIHDKIIGDGQLHSLRIVRAVLADGSPIIGIQVRTNEIGPLKSRLGMGNDFTKESGLSIFTMVRDGATIELDNNWRIQMTPPIHGERRMEINLARAYREAAVKTLHEQGAITEIIVGGESRRPRAFVPLDEIEGPKLLDKIFERNKPVRVIPTGTPGAPSGGGPTSSASMGLNVGDDGSRSIEVGRGDVPQSIEQARQAADFWLKQAQESIDRILNGQGTVNDQMIVHQNPVIAKHLLNWINTQDSSGWLSERIYVDQVIEEVTDYVNSEADFNKEQSQAEAIHYFPYVEEMMDELKRSQEGEELPKVEEEPTSPMASLPGAPILPAPPQTSGTRQYALPPVIDKKDLVSRNTILTNLAKKLQVPIRYGRFRQRALGIFKINSTAIRIKKAQDVSVAAHEVGHAINKILWGKRGQQLNWQPLVAHRAELEAIATKPLAGQSKLPEGFAEYIRYWITDPAQAAQLCPGVHLMFEGELAHNQDLAEILKEAQRDYKRWLDQTSSAKILSHISVQEPQYDQLGWFEKLYTGIVNHLNPIDVAVKIITKGRNIRMEEDPSKLAQALSGWAARAEHFLQVGTFGKDLDSILGPGLKQILAPMKDRLDDLRITAISLRTLEKKGLKGIEVGITVQEARESLIEQGFDPSALSVATTPAMPGHPSILAFDVNSLRAMTPEAQITKDTLMKLYKYQDDLLTYFRDCGMLSVDQYINIKLLNQFFVPFHRMYEAGAGEKSTESRLKSGSSAVDLWQPVKGMTGSWRPIIDPLESIIKNTYTLINVAERNLVGQALANLSKEDGAGRWISGPLTAKAIPQTFALERIKNALSAAGVDIADPNLNLDQLATIFVYNAVPSPKENIITVYFKGKPTLYQLEPNLYEAVKGLDKDSIGILMRIAAIPASILRTGATGINPEFASRNIARDMLTAWAQTEIGYVPGWDTAKGLAHVLMKDATYKEWMRSGGPHSAMSSMDRNEMKLALRDLMSGKLKYAVRHPIDTLRILSEISEAMTRVSVYAKSREKGESIRAAGFASREANLDFQRIGAWMRGMNLTIPFFNAAIQDVDKFVRVHKRNPKKALLKGAAFQLVSLIIYYLNKDDERYHEAPWWLRDLFWLFPTKGIPGLSGLTPWIPIPKPFSWGMFYATPAERIAEYLDTKDPSAFDDFVRNFLSNITPSLLPTIIKTPIELWRNQNFFTNREIESAWMQKNYLPEYRSNWYTSHFANQTALLLAKSGIHVSPVKIEHAMFSTFGGSARLATKLLLDPVSKIISPPKGGALPTAQLADTPLIRSIAVRFPHASLRSISKVHELWNEINLRYRSRKQSLKENNRFDIPPLTREEKDRYFELKYAVEKFNSINREIHRVIQDREYDSEEKRRRIDNAYMKMLATAQKSLKKLGIRKFKKKTNELQSPPDNNSGSLPEPPEE